MGRNCYTRVRPIVNYTTVKNTDKSEPSLQRDQQIFTAAHHRASVFTVVFFFLPEILKVWTH